MHIGEKNKTEYSIKNRLVKRDIIIRRFINILLFWAVYTILFFVAEQNKSNIHIIHADIDDMIPFCEYFIVPYVCWYALIVGTVAYFGLFLKNDSEYYRLIKNLVAGMAVFLAVCFIYPNGLELRPQLAGENIFEKAVMILYWVDTPTNVLPSLHVYNTVCCMTAVLKNDYLRSKKVIVSMLMILSVLIILATVFLKQHSVVDVAAALMLNVIFYLFIYREKNI